MVELLDRWKNGLARTRKTTFGRIFNDTATTEITNSVIDALKHRVRSEGLTESESFRQALQDELRAHLIDPPPIAFNVQPSVILLVGVNGSGKTTTAAKLAQYYGRQGKRVLLAAADTFRAAAMEQLEVWATRLNLPIITGQPGADPGSVTYDAIQAAIARNADYLLVDTAGRLHTRYNLMEELKKVYRVAGKALPGAPHAVWLVMDATTGQNALQQARAFRDAVDVSGVILAKLDSSARGGMAFAIERELNLPILFAGLGEGPEDIERFDPEAFVAGIMVDFK